jgi:PAS domain S-box-containing protein
VARSAAERRRGIGLPSTYARLQALYEMGQRVGRAGRVEDAYEAAIDGLIAVLGADRASILRFDESGVMRFVAWHGLSDEYRAAVEGHTPWTPEDEDARPITIPDVAADESLAGIRDTILEEGIRACAFVPLLYGGRVVGKFMLYYDDPHDFADDELVLAEAMATQIAGASERRRAEDMLRRQRDQYQQILSGVSDGITMLDAAGVVVYANEAALELIGLPLEEMLVRPPGSILGDFDMVDERGRPLQVRDVPSQAVLAGEPVEPRVIGFRRREESAGIRWALFDAAPIRGADGTLEGVLNVLRDVTEERAAEEERAELLERESRARETLERLSRVTEVALAHLTLEDLLGELMRSIVDVLEAETGAILLREGDELIVRASIGLGSAMRSAVSIPIGKGMAGSVAASRQPLIVEELEHTELVSPVLRARGIHSLVAIPLIVADDVIGVVHVGAEQPAKFGEEDARLLQLVADRIALAINQSKLFEAERASRARVAFLAEASEVVGSSLDYETALARVAELAVPTIADLCAVDIVADDGDVERLAVVHADPAKVALAHELATRAAPSSGGLTGVSAVIRTGAPQFIAELTDELLTDELLAAGREGADPELLELARALGLGAVMTLPLIARGRTLGAITFAFAESGRRYTEADFELGTELARRAAVGVDNARLFREAEERGQAARVLAAVGDGVFLVDGNDVVRYWNRAAELLTGLDAAETIGRVVADAIPGWAEIESRVPRATGGASALAQTLPLALGERELWLSISGVGFEDGTVYAFRDLTEERALEQMRSEFVSTVSHELRTPLAAIYGAAMTLQRPDMALGEVQRESLLGVISAEADRLARTVNDILWAARIDTDQVRIALESCNAALLTETVVHAQRAHLPANVEVALKIPDGLPPVAADPDKVRQVLVNLVENAVKYSPDGGNVEVALEAHGATVQFSIADEGLGIPAAEQRRIFEKFYRLDPQMTRGVGGTGMGVYICRELVRRMAGRIWVESEPGRGSVFHVELPVAGSDADFTAHLSRRRGTNEAAPRPPHVEH